MFGNEYAASDIADSPEDADALDVEDTDASDNNRTSRMNSGDDTDEDELSPAEEARRRAIRDRRSILGQNVVLPSTNATFIQNPMTDPVRPVKSAKIISTIQNNNAEFELFDKTKDDSSGEITPPDEEKQ